MTAAEQLLARCAALGVELGVAGTALTLEAAAAPPAALLADLAANKAELLALVWGPFGNCDTCGRALDDKRRCWRCCDRVCPCGRPTGSAFIELCILCGLRETAERPSDALGISLDELAGREPPAKRKGAK
jgi:hypothetical protein